MNAKLAKAHRAKRAGRARPEQLDRLRRAAAAAAALSPAVPRRATKTAAKPRKGHAPTWPSTDNQRAQSRPLIVLGKYRERNPSKRTKVKSAVAKHMDRPGRVDLVEKGHQKIMKLLGF